MKVKVIFQGHKLLYNVALRYIPEVGVWSVNILAMHNLIKIRPLFLLLLNKDLKTSLKGSRQNDFPSD